MFGSRRILSEKRWIGIAILAVSLLFFIQDSPIAEGSEQVAVFRGRLELYRKIRTETDCDIPAARQALIDEVNSLIDNAGTPDLARDLLKYRDELKDNK